MSQESARILIVEDDPGLQTQLKWCFDGLEVHQAGNREDAIAAVRRFEPQVVLQDLGLPPDAEGVTEGLATLQEILRLAPRTKVIVVTGNADRDNAVRSVALGAYDFYSKPIDTDVLRLLVQRAFHISRLERELGKLLDAQANTPLEGIIATDASMQKACRTAEKWRPPMYRCWCWAKAVPARS